MKFALLRPFLQDRRKVQTATCTLGSPTIGQGVDLAIFPGIWTYANDGLERLRGMLTAYVKPSCECHQSACRLTTAVAATVSGSPSGHACNALGVSFQQVQKI